MQQYKLSGPTKFNFRPSGHFDPRGKDLLQNKWFEWLLISLVSGVVSGFEEVMRLLPSGVEAHRASVLQQLIDATDPVSRATREALLLRVTHWNQSECRDRPHHSRAEVPFTEHFPAFPDIYGTVFRRKNLKALLIDYADIFCNF